MQEAIVPWVGHGPKMGQNEFDCLCFCDFHILFLWCFMAHTQSQWDTEVSACFRGGFLKARGILRFFKISSPKLFLKSGTFEGLI